MKRIQYACLDQTIHFQLKEEIAHDLAVAEVQAEYENYKSALDRKHVKYKIAEELPQEDSSIIIRIKTQYNSYDVGDYLD